MPLRWVSGLDIVTLEPCNIIVECIWMSMACRPKWPFSLRYGSRNTRHINFPRVDGLSTDTSVLGRHKL